MDGVLSQEEINALLNNPGGMNSGGTTASGGGSASGADLLTPEEKDEIGEIANISMGTAATTLFSLVNRQVEISTPVVSTATWDDVVRNYERPCVFIRIAYTVGLDGSNILVLKENDVEKTVCLQGNYAGFQNLYTYESQEKYPDIILGAATYDLTSYNRIRIIENLFDKLKFKVIKMEMSNGSGYMANHDTISLDGDL